MPVDQPRRRLPEREPHDRLPIKRLLLGVALVVATPVTLIVLVSERGTEAPTPAVVPATRPAPSAIPEVAPPPPVIAENEDSPRSSPHDEDLLPELSPPDDDSPVWSVELVSSGTSVVSPWAALGPSDAEPPEGFLPAPLGFRYLALQLNVRCLPESGAIFRPADVDGGQASVQLAAGGIVVSPMGHLSQLPSMFAPFVAACVTLSPGEPPADITVVFLLPNDVGAAELLVDGRPAHPLSIDVESPLPLDRLQGVWHRMPGQRLHQRYPDPVAQAICAGAHQALSIQRRSPGHWDMSIPFTEVAIGPIEVSHDGTRLEAQFKLGGVERLATVRPIGQGDLLVLYVGDEPAQRVVYRRPTAQ